MRQIHCMVIMAAAAAGLSACAARQGGTQGEPPVSNTETPTVDLTQHPTPVGTLPGWTAVDVEGAPAGTVFTRSGVTAAATTCPSGFVCLYQNSNRGGFVLSVQSGIGVGNFLGVPCSTCTNGIHGNNGTFNDQMSSWQNASGRRYCWWFDINFSGEVHPMENGLIVNVLPRENDQASSFGPC